MDRDELAAYIQGAFTAEKIKSELEDVSSTFFLADLDGAPVGYVKLRSGPRPECLRAETSVELERIYADQAFIGKGVGSALMKAVLDKARSDRHGSVWLGVWEHNAQAILFYGKWGFEEVGEKTFTVGGDVQRDVVFELVL